MDIVVEQNAIFLYERIDRTAQDVLRLLRANDSLDRINKGFQDLAQRVEELTAFYELTEAQ